MRGRALVVLVLLASCDGCSERVPGVCCTSDAECARLGLPPGSASEYSCGTGQVCRDFYCLAEEPPDAPELDAAIDAPSDRCNPNAPFGAPTRLANMNDSQVEELSLALTGDQLKAYLVRYAGLGNHALLTAQRTSLESDFGAPVPDPTLMNLASISGDEFYLYPSFDDRYLYYKRDSTWVVSSRQNTNEPFDSGAIIYADGTPLSAARLMISSNSTTLYWSITSSPLRASTKGNSYTQFVNTRNITLFELTDFVISNDELVLYYSNYPNPDIYRTTRASKNVPFDVGIPVENVNTSSGDFPLYISPDACFLYIRAGAVVSVSENDIWVTRRGR